MFKSEPTPGKSRPLLLSVSSADIIPPVPPDKLDAIMAPAPPFIFCSTSALDPVTLPKLYVPDWFT